MSFLLKESRNKRFLKNCLEYWKFHKPAKERCDYDRRKIIGDFQFGGSDQIGAERDDDQGADTCHLSNRRIGENRCEKTGKENKESLKSKYKCSCEHNTDAETCSQHGGRKQIQDGFRIEETVVAGNTGI